MVQISGWTYGLDGALLKATRITGIKNFKVNEMGLVPIKVDIWGPFVLLNFEGGLPKEDFDTNVMGTEWLGTPAELLSANGVDDSLDYVCRREYTIECNWKVFCDNYLDGGYHVSCAHKGLASGLNLESYSIKMFEKVSIQSCDGGAVNSEEEYDRLGSNALYAFVYPNFMINRYGPWMDTNLVVPLGPRKCQVIFDYFLDPSHSDNSDFIEKSLEDGEKVQVRHHFSDNQCLHISCLMCLRNLYEMEDFNGALSLRHTTLVDTVQMSRWLCIIFIVCSTKLSAADFHIEKTLCIRKKTKHRQGGRKKWWESLHSGSSFPCSHYNLRSK